MHSKNRLASGGDDMMLRLWDLRDFSAPVASNKKNHTAGVTAV